MEWVGLVCIADAFYAVTVDAETFGASDGGVQVCHTHNANLLGCVAFVAHDLIQQNVPEGGPLVNTVFL